MESKSELRLKFKAIRKNLKSALTDEIFVNKIRNSNLYKSALNVMLFYPVKSEICLLDLLRDNKKFYFPKVQGESLLVCPDNGEYKVSGFNIPEPVTNPVNPEILDLIIIPALSADKNGYRLGYGGGYYDRFLSKYPDIPTILPLYKELFTDELPHETTDIKIQTIITD